MLSRPRPLPQIPGLLFALLPVGLSLAMGAEAGEVKPIRALLVTGGCCHDYSRQKTILSEGISERSPVEWTIVQQGGTTTDTRIALYEKEDWADGYDVVVHNECFAGVVDPAWTARILAPHRRGLPAVVIHCAMHCYRDRTDEWFKFLGVTSHGHGANYPFEVVNLAPKDPIMQGFGPTWRTPKGELYLISKVWETATPLAHARSRDTKRDEVCVWTNQYGKARVFGTTLGHHNEEVSDPTFLNLATRGLLWAVDRLDDAHLKPTGRRAAEGKRPLVPEDLAHGKPATASTNQDDARSPAAGNDGNLETRWCASDSSAPQWWQVDLGKAEDLTGCRITWEGEGDYRYRVEGSADGKAWRVLSDQEGGGVRDQERRHAFRAGGVRYVRVRVTGLEGGRWASFFECAVFGTRMVEAAPGTASEKPRGIGGAGLLAGIRAPEGFDVRLFAAPPDIHYPTCLTAAPTGELFVGVDENGSIDARPHRGRVVRCVDRDDDGKADLFNVFAEMDSPRGLVYDAGTLYVLHPPTLTAFHDDDGDGDSDRSETLVSGIGFDLKFRGADHTTNGIRLGIDGWLYVAVGDYGFVKATGKDGQSRQLHGGGVVRVRTDGSGLEVVSRGQRNIYDVAISPTLDLFTRDNTNDGGGWDVRLSQIVPGGQYGYPSLFTRFSDEIVPPLADYGGGSPTGSMYLQEPGFPAGFDDTLYTCEWGRSVVYRHPLLRKGAGFVAGQVPFLELPRPTDIDVDGRSRMFVSTWREGGFTYSTPYVGYVVRVTYGTSSQPPFPDLKAAADVALRESLTSASDVRRLHAQREILRRGVRTGVVHGLAEIARREGSLAGRVAAIFTLEQLLRERARPTLIALTKMAEIREYALRALADRVSGPDVVPTAPFLEALDDRDPRVRLQAISALARLGRREASAAIVPRVADADPLVAHLAVEALIALRGDEACLQALRSGNKALIPGCVRVLQSRHDPEVVDALIASYEQTTDEVVRDGVLKALARLLRREAPWEGKWWGTRPDTSGPYFEPVRWDQSEKIGRFLEQALESRRGDAARSLLIELLKNRVDSEEVARRAIDLAGRDPSIRSVTADLLNSRATLPPAAIDLLERVASDPKEDGAIRSRAIRGLLRHRTERGVGDALVRVFATAAAEGAIPADVRNVRQEFLGDPRNVSKLPEYIAMSRGEDRSRQAVAFDVLLAIADQPRMPRDARLEATRALDRSWGEPGRVAELLRAVARGRSESQAARVRSHLDDRDPEVRSAATEAARAIGLDRKPAGATDPGPTLAKLPMPRILAIVAGEKGDATRGGLLFQKLGCIACHTVSSSEPPKGPFLGGIGARYSRPELVESILRPGAKIAQGFETQTFATISGQVFEGFVARESGDEVEIRNAQGVATLIPKKEIEERGKTDVSVMPNGLGDTLTPAELASLLGYLESLPAKPASQP